MNSSFCVAYMSEHALSHCREQQIEEFLNDLWRQSIDCTSCCVFGFCATPNALSSGKVKRGFGGIFGCWIGAVVTVINILNRVASELIAKVDRY